MLSCVGEGLTTLSCQISKDIYVQALILNPTDWSACFTITKEIYSQINW
jgi:hypothetical protein